MGGIGALVLLAIIPVYRRAHSMGKIQITGKNVFAVLIGIAGCMALGYGLSLCTLGTQGQMIRGIIVGVIGLIACAVNYPVYQLRNN